MSVDYGQKRVGIAVSDEMRIIATGLKTIASKDIWRFLAEYLSQENVDCIVVGKPTDMQNNPSDASRFIEPFVRKLIKTYPEVKIDRYDERFTSKIAQEAMLAGGLGKKRRQDKALVDTVSATLILQSYMAATGV
jgi:putative Holliday junction resolvase